MIDVYTVNCTLRWTIFECKDCEWISIHETEYLIHRLHHSVTVRYHGPTPRDEEGPPIGKCFRCGQSFSSRILWELHEGSRSRPYKHVEYARGTKHYTMESQELMAYRREPLYVRLGQNSPGSPVGWYAPGWEGGARRFSRERAKLRAGRRQSQNHQGGNNE